MLATPILMFETDQTPAAGGIGSNFHLVNSPRRLTLAKRRLDANRRDRGQRLNLRMIGQFYNTLSRYGHVVRWICRDLLGAFGRDVALILLTRIGSIVCLVFTLGVVTGYARILEQDRQLEFGRWAVVPRESLTLLVIVGVIALLFMIVGSSLNYLSGWWGVRLRSEYGAYCGQRVISHAAEGRRLWMPAATDEQPDKFLRRLARRNATRCGRVAAQLITTVVPTALVLVLAIPVLFYIHAWLTLAVIVLLSVSLTIHYQINVRAARQMLEREKCSSLAAREYSSLLQQGAEQPVPGGSDTVAERFARAPITDAIEADTQYRSVSHNSQFLSDLFVALTIMTILVVLGGSILLQGTGWGELLVYLVASRYTLGQMRSLLSAIANSNRFYHQIREFFLFLENVQPAAEDTSKPPKKLTLRVRDASTLLTELRSDAASNADAHHQSLPTSTDASFDHAAIRPGQRVGVLTTLSLNRFTLPEILGALIGQSSRSKRVDEVLSHTAIVSRRSPLWPDSTLAVALGLNPEDGLTPVQPILQACGQWNRVRGMLADDADATQSLDGPVPDDLDDELRLTLVTAAVAARSFRIILIERSALRKLNDSTRDVLLDHLAHAIVLIVANDPEQLGQYNERFIAVIHEGKLVGLGDRQWFEQHRTSIADLLSQTVRTATDSSHADDLDDADVVDEN